jgi:hypothetical protein
MNSPLIFPMQAALLMLLIPLFQGCATSNNDTGLWNQPYQWEKGTGWFWDEYNYPDPLRRSSEP